MHRFLASASSGVNRGIEYLVCAMGMAMAAIVGAQVFSRYALNHSLFWSEELARFLLVWLTFLGASSAYYRGAHPGVDAVFKRMPAKMQKVSALVVHAASLGLFGIMTVYGLQFAWFVRLQITPALGLPKWVVMAVVPVSGLILTLHCLAFAARDFTAQEAHDH